MDALDLARWQFAITTVYHFLFVPVTIGMSALVAVVPHRLGARPAARTTCGWPSSSASSSPSTSPSGW